MEPQKESLAVPWGSGTVCALQPRTRLGSILDHFLGARDAAQDLRCITAFNPPGNNEMSTIIVLFS